MNWLICGSWLLPLLIGLCGDKYVEEKPQIASTRELVAIVKHHFETLESFQGGDLVTTEHVKPLVSRLKKAGWEVPNSNQLISQFVQTGSFLDRTLNNGSGRKFFREISKIPNGVDRLERMGNLKNGRESINQLVNYPNGSDLVKSLATSKVGRNMGQRAGNTSDGRNFNKPTGKIYTEQDLAKELVKRFKEDPARKRKK